VRPASLFIVVALCLSVAGCASWRDSKANPRNWFSKNSSSGSQASSSGGGSRLPAAEPYDTSSTASNPTRGAGSGVLAGRVIDVFNQMRPGAAIHVLATDATPNEPPIESVANEKGYFVVQGLEPGRRYRLAARLYHDGRLMAGTTFAIPPNPVVMIKVSEDLAGLDVPPLKTKPDRHSSAGDGSWAPDSAPKYLHEPDHGRPPAPPALEGNPQYKPEMQTDTGRNIPPRATIPSGPPSQRPSSVGEPFSRPNAMGDLSSSSCTVVGNRLADFMLPDLMGQPFQLSQTRRKLVLLDFWGTWCANCIQSMPYLIDLQRRYAPQGFEVIGLAYEADGPLSKKVEQVNFIKLRQGVNYKILLGQGDSCQVLNKLDVRNFPTLILIDENGEIIWRGEGLSPQNKARLELEISRRLGI
jgi:thiol-disulfide isomerase/thioredoxin